MQFRPTDLWLILQVSGEMQFRPTDLWLILQVSGKMQFRPTDLWLILQVSGKMQFRPTGGAARHGRFPTQNADYIVKLLEIIRVYWLVRIS